MNFRYSAAGFRNDMEELFSRFTSPVPLSDEKTPNELSLRFTRFCYFWREMRFSLIFNFRRNERDLREFVDEIFLEVLPHICSEYPLERRVCSLYLLYSLFVKQPKISQKIRLNFQYLEQIRDLIKRCKELDQMDVCYIWYKLLSLGAIDLVHVSRLMGPFYIRNSRVTNEGLTETDFIIDEFRTSIYPPINELSHIHEKYRTIKESLIDKNSEINEECNQIVDNIFELTKAKADNLHKQFFSNNLSELTIETDSESQDMDEKHVDIGTKRRKIKDKALGFNTKNSEQNSQTFQTNERKSKKRKRLRGRPKIAKYTEIM